MDLHKMMAALAYNVKYKEVTPEQRYWQKCQSWGKFYGMQLIDFNQLFIDTKTELIEKGLATEDDFKEQSNG